MAIVDVIGFIHLADTCKVAGLGNYDSSRPYRDGSSEYYIEKPRVVDDPMGMGAFLLAAVKAERL